MKKFIVLYMMPASAMQEMMQNTPPEEMKKGMDEWMTWMKSHSEIVDIGGPLGKNMRVTKDSAEEVSNDIGGYSFIEAESKEAAAKLLQDSPHFQMPNTYVELMEVGKM